MATFTVTTAQNIDELTVKAGGDTYNINGGTLTIDQDSRYGTNSTTSTSIGPMTLSATLGGVVEIDARFVRLIPYNTGTGNVPASNTVISQGSASGKLIGVYASLAVAPTAAGVAMPATGFIKIKQWNSVAYSAAALTGISATATDVDRVGWIELVGDDNAACTVNRLNNFRVRGDWFALGTTDGTRATTYQIPSNGTLQYHGGVWVETGTATGIYEFYPCVGSLTALASNFATDAVRGKVCWIASTGLLRFGHDGTNSTGGYIPPSGRRIRMANVFMACCTSAARTANVLPNATLATRYEFATTGGGALDINYTSCSWYLNVNQPYSFNMTNSAVCTAIVATEVAAPMTWDNVGVGHEGANTQTALTLSLCFAGGTFNKVVMARTAQGAVNTYVVSLTDIDGFTFTNCRFISFGKALNATAGSITANRVNNTTFTTTTLGGGRVFAQTCTNLHFTTTTYYDHPATTTTTGIPMYAFDLASNCLNMTFDGLDFGGLVMCQPYSGILGVGAAGCTNIKLRNLGTAAAPLDMGGARVDAATWTRATTTATVTKVAHGLKANDVIYVIVSSDVAAITIAAKTVLTAPTADTITFACLSAGAASGTVSYYPMVAGYMTVIAAAAAANTIKMQRCYGTHMRSGLYTADNSSKNITFESAWADPTAAPTIPVLNGFHKGVLASIALTAGTAVYGTHWLDWFNEHTTPNVAAQAWARTTTVATVTSVGHNLRVGSIITVNTTSDAGAIVLGQKTIATVPTKDTYTFTCLNAGAASGTVTFVPHNGRLGILMNEATANTAATVTEDAGTPGFTSAGGLYMPAIAAQVTFTQQTFMLGHSTFPTALPVMAGGTMSNYDITYAIDTGSGFGSFKNLAYPRAGGGGASASTNVTMTSTTGVAQGDYVFGTGIAPNAKVSSITNATTVVVDIANTGTVSGVLTFNQLPSEAALPSTGAKFKWRILTTTTNTTAITSLFVYTYSTDTTRAYQYSLDPTAASLVLTGLQPGTEVRVIRTSDDAELAGVEDSGTSFTYNYLWDGVTENVYIVVHALGYLPVRYEAQLLTSTGLTLPIQQTIDRQYLNPV